MIGKTFVDAYGDYFLCTDVGSKEASDDSGESTPVLDGYRYADGEVYGSWTYVDQVTEARYVPITVADALAEAAA